MKIRMRNIIMIIFIIICLPTFAFAEDAEQDASSESLSDAQAAYESAQTAYDNGPITFLNERMSNSKYYVQNQENLLSTSSDSTVSTAYSKYSSRLHASFTFDNLRKQADWLDELNSRRANDDNFTSTRNHAALKLSPELVATSMMSTMVSYSNYYHALFNSSDKSLINLGYAENLAWGYSNPLEGWYDEEKEIYDNDDDGETGHYLLCIKAWPSTAVVGFGMTGSCTALRFDFKPVGNSYTADEWRTEVTEYESELEATLTEAKEKYETLQEAQKSKETESGTDNSGNTDIGFKSGKDTSTETGKDTSSETDQTGNITDQGSTGKTENTDNTGSTDTNNTGSGSSSTSGNTDTSNTTGGNASSTSTNSTKKRICCTAPSKVAKPSVKAKKAKLTIKWKKPSKSTGKVYYQVAIKRTGKKYKKYKYYYTTSTSKTVKHLKRHKKYTVKVRAYVKDGNQKHYGTWSKTKVTRVK